MGGEDTKEELFWSFFPLHVFFFISTPFFSAQPQVAYCKAVFEPQVCLEVCWQSGRIDKENLNISLGLCVGKSV